MSAVPTLHPPSRLRFAFLGSFAIALVFILGVFASAIYLAEANVRERDLAERTAAVAKLFATKLDKDGHLLHAVVRALMGDDSLAEAFRRADRAALERQGRNLFETLRSDHRVTHLYFTRPDRVNIYRFHDPPLYGDTITRATMLQAAARKAPVHGLELGPLGTLTLRLVVPWRHAGRDLGFVETGEEVKHLIDEIRDSLGVELLVLVDKKVLPAERWLRGQAMMNRSGEWDRYSTHVALAQTAGTVPDAFDDRALYRLRAGERVEIDDRGRAWQAALVPLADAGEHHIGELVLLRDITTLKSTFNHYMAIVALLCLAVAGAVWGVFWISLKRVESVYQRQHELEHRLLHLDTEHRRILQVEKLSALGTMVGGIAHQLNNPLVGVVNMAELAQRDADDPARVREILGDIRRAGEDCRGFVRRMLEFSKVSCFESKPTPLDTLVADTVTLFRQAEPRHLPVDIRMPEPAPVLVVDPILVRHALFNLLLNAAQATSGVAPITIEIERRKDPASGSTSWAVSVLDRGGGIAAEAMDKLFVPFFTTRSDGTGLGLAVVLHVALLHEGHVTAANRPDGGAQFTFWLPADIEVPTPPAAPMARPVPDAGPAPRVVAHTAGVPR